MNNIKNTKSRPVKTAGYSFAKQRARRNKRRQEAESRNKAWSALSTADKLNALDMAKHAAAKQRAGLLGEQDGASHV